LKRFKAFHPFLFAIFPIVFLAVYNMSEVSATDAILPVLIVSIVTLALLLLLNLFVKNRNKTAIIVSIFWILFFCYGYAEPVMLPLVASAGGFLASRPIMTALALWLCVGIVASIPIIRCRVSFNIFTKFLNITSIALIIVSLVSAGIGSVKSAIISGDVDKAIAIPAIQDGTRNNTQHSTRDSIRDSTRDSTQDTLPDIYYIILDAYTRSDKIEEIFGYDNSQFIDYLTDKGFYVASRSCSNYSCTATSLPSSLNMRYLTTEECYGAAANIKLLCDNEVSHFLKSKGYQYIFVSSGQFSKGMPKYADTYTPSRTLFGGSVFATTDLMISLIQMTPLEPFVLQYFTYGHHRGGVLYAFDTLASMPDIDTGQPKFVFAHILCPHVPNVFNRDGSPPLKGEGNYLDQLIFISRKTEMLVDELLAKSDTPPIIILQGDHGSQPGSYEILNAYHLPGKDNGLLYDNISPANSFRVIFNLYFGADYELVEEIDRG